MEVHYLLLARYAETVAGGLNIIGGGIAVYTPKDLPFHIPQLYVASQIELNTQDVDREHTISYRLIGPHEELVSETEDFNLPRTAIPEKRIAMYANFVIAFLNLVILAEGRYRVQLVYDGQVIKEVALRIEPTVPEGQAAVQASERAAE